MCLLFVCSVLEGLYIAPGPVDTLHLRVVSGECVDDCRSLSFASALKQGNVASAAMQWQFNSAAATFCMRSQFGLAEHGLLGGAQAVGGSPELSLIAGKHEGCPGKVVALWSESAPGPEPGCPPDQHALLCDALLGASVLSLPGAEQGGSAMDRAMRDACAPS